MRFMIPHLQVHHPKSRCIIMATTQRPQSLPQILELQVRARPPSRSVVYPWITLTDRMSIFTPAVAPVVEYVSADAIRRAWTACGMLQCTHSVYVPSFLQTVPKLPEQDNGEKTPLFPSTRIREQIGCGKKSKVRRGPTVMPKQPWYWKAATRALRRSRRVYTPLLDSTRPDYTPCCASGGSITNVASLLVGNSGAKPPTAGGRVFMGKE